MRKLAFAFLGFLLFLLIVQVHGDSIWIDGTVTSTPQELPFDTSIYIFDFNVQSSNSALSGNITCLALKTLASSWQVGEHYNFTGQYIQPNDTIAFTAFVVTGINTPANSTQNTDWLSALQTVFDGMSNIGKQIVAGIIAVCVALKFAVPEYMVGFGLVAITGLLGWIRIRWYVSLVSAVLGALVACYLMQIYLLLLLGISF
jgi:type IV secretory pathway VirB2 component (pilin)